MPIENVHDKGPAHPGDERSNIGTGDSVSDLGPNKSSLVSKTDSDPAFTFAVWDMFSTFLAASYPYS